MLNLRLLVATLVFLGVAVGGSFAWRAVQVRRTAHEFLDRADELEDEARQLEADQKVLEDKGELSEARQNAIEARKKWEEAADYVFRYLQIRPSDAEAHARVAQTWDRCAVDPGRKRRAVDLFYEALGKVDADAQIPLRRRLAELLLEQGRLAAATDEVQKLPDDKKDDKENARGWGVLALALYAQKATKTSVDARATDWPAGSIGASFKASGGTIEKAFEKAIALDPGRLALATTCARLYRDDAQLLSPKTKEALPETERHKRADQVIDAMVKASPRNSDVYLARHLYRDQYGLSGAVEDLNAAIQYGPNRPAVWLGAAEHSRREAARAEQSAGREKAYQEACARYQKVIDLAPGGEAGYRGLGEVLLGLGQTDKGIKTWQQGLEKADPRSFRLNTLLADVLIVRGRLDEAGKHLQVTEELITQLGPYMQASIRLSWTQTNDLLKARLHLAKGEAAEAVPILKRVASGQRTTPLELAQCVQACWLLGETYAGWSQWDRAAAAYEQALKLDPGLIQLRLRAGTAWENAGRPDAAITHFERTVDMAPSAANYLALAGAHFQRLVRLPKDSRDWAPFNQALGAAKKPKDGKPLAEPWRLALLEAQYAVARGDEKAAELTARGDEKAAKAAEETARRDAADILRAAEKNDPKSPLLLQSCAAVYEQLGCPADADRVVQAIAQTDAKSAAVFLARARLQSMRGQAKEARATLETGLKTVPAKEQPALRRELAQRWLAEGQADRAQEQLSQLSEKEPANLPLICRLAETALESGSLQTVRDCVKRLRALEGPDSASAAYYETRQLLVEAKGPSDPALAKAAQQQALLSSQRPQWSGTHAILGMILEARGDVSRAIEAYQESIRLGEQRLIVSQRLISALLARGRVAEADQYLAQLRDYVPLSEGLSSLESSVAARRSQPDRARQAAERAVKLRPSDPRAQLWLGMLSSAEGKPQEAETALRKAIELAPENLQVLNSLLAFYVRDKKPELAQKALQAFADNPKLKPIQRVLALAAGYEVLGDRQQAKKQYQEAIRLVPDDEAVHLGLVEFLLRSGSEQDVAEAEKMLRDFLGRVPQAGNTRRVLAGMLIGRGGESPWQEAIKLLGQSGSDASGSSLDRRMEARALLRRQGTENVAKARQILEALVADPGTRTADDRLLLAGVYETEGKPESLKLARQQYAALVDVAKPVASHLASYADFLLRHKLLDEAGASIDKLQQADPDALGTIRLRIRWLDARGRTAEIEPLVEAYAARLLKQAARDKPSESQLCANVGALYSSVQLHQAAEGWHRRLAGLSPESYGPLVASLARQNRFPEAIDLCVQAAKSDDSPRPAMTLAAAMAAGQPTKEDAALADPFLARILEKHKTDADLLLRLANVRIVQQRAKEAIELYRQVVGLRPKDAVALNNLAALLGEQPGNGPQEGLQYVDQAIQIAGPQPLLLDTKAMILFHEGKFEEAAKLLETATATAPPIDPLWHSHLAAAYLRLGKTKEARQAMKTAEAGKRESLLLTEADRRLLAELKDKLK